MVSFKLFLRHNMARLGGRRKKVFLSYKQHVSVSTVPRWQLPARTLPADGIAQLKEALGILSATRPGASLPLHASLYCIWRHVVLLVGTARADWHFIQQREASKWPHFSYRHTNSTCPPQPLHAQANISKWKGILGDTCSSQLTFSL